MPTWTALTTLPGEAAAAALSAGLEALEPAPIGVGIFDLEDGSGLWEVGGYFEAAPDPVALALLAAAHGAAEFAVSEVPETDWVAHVRRELSPVEAGRFFVHGAHDAHRVPPDRIALQLEAAMAFGTGHHGTTKGCLLALDALADGHAPGTVADVGCGTAVLAMAAARVFPDARIVASDIDPVAVDVATANVSANGLGDRVRCVRAEGFDHPALREAPMDLVFANILKGPLVRLAPDMAATTKVGSHVILSGILGEQATDVAAVYARAGFNEIARHDIVDWSTLVLRRVT